MRQLYCSVSEIIGDIGDVGKPESFLVEKIEAASDYISNEIGQFLPSLETVKTQAVSGFAGELLVKPLLSVTAIRNDGTTLSAADYVLHPDGRHWANGPYTSIVPGINPGASAGSWSTELEGVEIDGRWGLYDESVDLGLPVISQPENATVLNVHDGSKLSPGMTLLIETEWELVTGTGSPANSGASLESEIDSSALEITLDDGSLLSAGEVIRIDFERMQVLEISGNDVLVTRGHLGSARATHAADAAVWVYRSFIVRRGVNGSTAATHLGNTVYAQKTPADLNYLCREIAALMIKKSQTGYVGRAGSDELGGGFWVNEFPKVQVEAVKSNYFWGGR